MNAKNAPQTKAVTSKSPLKKKNSQIVYVKVQLKYRNVSINVWVTQSKKGKITDESNDQLLGLDDAGVMEELDTMR